MHNTTFLTIILVMAFSFPALAQNTPAGSMLQNTTVSWTLGVPPNVKNVNLQIFDLSGKQIWNDSVPAASGVIDNLPLPVVSVGESKFNAGIYSNMGEIMINVDSNVSEDASVRAYDIIGNLFSQQIYHIHPGKNIISFVPETVRQRRLS
jgi:hypothetical protein